MARVRKGMKYCMAKDSIEQSQSENRESSVVAVPVTAVGTTEDAEPLVAVVEQRAAEAQPSERREIVKSASLVMLGNLGSSVMGMVRQIVVASTGTTIAGPFLAALRPAQTFNDLLVNGSVSGALIPTFNDYAAPEKRDELRRLVFTIVNLVFIVMLVASILFFFFAPWFVDAILVPHYTPEDRLRTLQLARVIFFSLLGLGPFAVLLAALYALKEFGWPAFATVSYHFGIIIGAAIGAFVGLERFGYLGLGIGVLIGVVGELVLLMPGIRKQRLGYMFILDLKHPALPRILKLYAPVAFSFLMSMGLIFLDQNLASGTPCMSFMARAKECGEANTSALSFATTLIQFPVGLVAAALSFAVLPTLTAHMRDSNLERFKDTLLLGFRLGLLLMIPAAAGLIVLQVPIIRLIFEHGNYKPNDARLAAIALQYYAFQLPFVALDQILINAFYARKNTIIPVAVYVVSLLGYLGVALPFSQTWGMPALALANTVQNSSHAIVLLLILRAVIGPMHIRKTIPVVLKILLATAAMVAVAWGLQLAMAHSALFSLDHLLGRLLTVIIAGGVATGVYFGLVLFFKVEEVALLKGAVLAKLGKK